MGYLLLDLVGAAEHVVNVGEVVSARQDTVNLTLGGVVLLEVSLLTEITHLSGVSHVDSTIVRALKGELTASYASGATTRLASKRLWMSSDLAMFS